MALALMKRGITQRDNQGEMQREEAIDKPRSQGVPGAPSSEGEAWHRFPSDGTNPPGTFSMDLGPPEL